MKNHEMIHDNVWRIESSHVYDLIEALLVIPNGNRDVRTSSGASRSATSAANAALSHGQMADSTSSSFWVKVPWFDFLGTWPNWA